MLDPKKRMAQLKALKLSPGVLHLAEGKEGDDVDSVFFTRCEEPHYIYCDGAVLPEGGSDLVPLWECGVGYYAAWKRKGRLEFIEFDLEVPQEYKVVGYNEQGLLAHLFSDLIGFIHGQVEHGEKLVVAAKKLGFKHFNKVVAVMKKHFESDDYEHEREFYKGLAKFTRGLK